MVVRMQANDRVLANFRPFTAPLIRDSRSVTVKRTQLLHCTLHTRSINRAGLLSLWHLRPLPWTSIRLSESDRNHANVLLKLTGSDSMAFDEIVQVKVGRSPSDKIFRLHKGVLRFYSGYFDRALGGGFLEAKNGVVNLETEDASIFEMFQYWLYNRRFHPVCQTMSALYTSLRGWPPVSPFADLATQLQDAESDVKDTPWAQLAQLWVFGDAHEVPMLQNVVVGLIHKKVISTWVVPTGEVDYIYSNTLVGSKLRLYVTAIIGNTGDAQSKMQVKDEGYFCKEALGDLLRVTWVVGFKKSSKDDVAKWDMCQYHVHEKGTKCETGGK